MPECNRYLCLFFGGGLNSDLSSVSLPLSILHPYLFLRLHITGSTFATRCRRCKKIRESRRNYHSQFVRKREKRKKRKKRTQKSKGRIMLHSECVHAMVGAVCRIQRAVEPYRGSRILTWRHLTNLVFPSCTHYTFTRTYREGVLARKHTFVQRLSCGYLRPSNR